MQSKMGKIYSGIKTGLTEAFVIDEAICNQLIAEDSKSLELIKPFLAGRDIKRYETPTSEKYLIFTRRGVNIDGYPAILKYLLQFKDRLTPKPNDWNGGAWSGRKPGIYQWYEIQDSIDYHAEFEKTKILWPEIAKGIRFTLCPPGVYANNKVFFIPITDLYLLGIMNSGITWFYLKHTCSILGDADKGGRPMFQEVFVKTLPIPTIDFSDPTDVALHDTMVSLVEQILDLNKQKQSEIQGFLKWLEDEIGTKIRDLTGASKLHEYYNLDFSGFHAILTKNKRKLKEGYDPIRRGPKEILESEFNDSVAKIKLLTAKSEETDRQIDALVYKLYDLTEEEIRIVDGHVECIAMKMQ